LGEAAETAKNIKKEASELIQKIDNLIDKKGFITDKEAEKIEAAKKISELKKKYSDETIKLLDKLGWDGKPIENTNNTQVLNQMDLNALKKAGLPDSKGACVFFSTVYGAADALGITISPQDMSAIYNKAKENNAVGSGKWGIYGVDSYPGIIKAVAEVKGADARNISIPDTQIKTTSASGKEVTKDIISALQSGGSAQVRYSGHSMCVTGSYIENGTVILNIKDTASPNRKTYVDTSTMSLYTLNKENERVPSDRVLTHYLPIIKNSNVAVNKN